jgi:hypothetical protein
MSIWKAHLIENKNCYLWRVDGLEFRVFRRDREWVYSFLYSDPYQPTFSPVECEQVSYDPGMDWTRLITQSDVSLLALAPRAPDRPVVIRPDRPFLVNPGAQVKIFFSLPLWISAHLGADGERTRKEDREPLFETPVRRLSSTWLGDTMEGKLCYGLRTDLYENPDEIRIYPGCALCSLHVLNQSSEALSVDKLAIPSGIITLYRRTKSPLSGGSFMQTSEVNLLYSREKTISVTVAPRTLHSPDDLEIEAEPRNKAGDSFWKKSLTVLKKISNY